MSSDSLAIIIPYYKIDFFEAALLSIKQQTNQNFTVYIGNDNSPYDPETVLKRLNSDGWVTKKVVYQKFETNLGKESLIKQWTRCIELSQHEDWIWLFSDDDIMEPNCVENFYRCLNETQFYYDLYKFNTVVISDSDAIVPNTLTKGDGVVNSFTLIMQKITGMSNTFVVEYIFSRKVFTQKNGFVDFPLGWGSDDATWVKFSGDRGIFIIPCSKVLWRLSQRNISGNKLQNGKEKVVALLSYCNWIIEHFHDHREIFILKEKMLSFFLGQVNDSVSFLSPGLFFKIYRRLYQTLSLSFKTLSSFAYHKNVAFLKKRLYERSTN